MPNEDRPAPKLVLTSGWRGARDYVLEVISQEMSQDPTALHNVLVLVPTASAGHLLQIAVEPLLFEERQASLLPTISTMSRLLAELTERSLGNVRVADAILRDTLMEVSLDEAAEAGSEPPFQLRGSLASRVLAFFDHLYLAGFHLEDFTARSLKEFDIPDDRGAERMAAQTRFLYEGFQRYRKRLLSLELEDEQSVRGALKERGPLFPYRRILALGPSTLWPADISFLASSKGMTGFEVVIPESMATTWWTRALEKAATFERIRKTTSESNPRLWCPAPSADDKDTNEANGHQSAVAWVARDREEVLSSVARLLKYKSASGELPPLRRVAIAVPSPLPYLYLAKKSLGDAGVPYQVQDDFPLAAEPYMAAMDLVLEYVESDGRRAPAIGLLQSPFFHFGGVGPESVAALDRELRKSREPGGTKVWKHLFNRSRRRPIQRALPGMEDREQTAMPALEALVKCGRQLSMLSDPHSSLTAKVEALRKFIDAFGRPLRTLEDVDRHERARGAFLTILEKLSDAARTIGDPPVTFHLFREKLHRAIESHTFSIRTGEGGIQIVDSRSVSFGSFDLIVAVGLNEGEWPARSERNIFYPQWLLKDFGWPTDSEALTAERARFMELLRIPDRSVAVFRHLLEEEIPTVPSPFLEEVDNATRKSREEIDPIFLERLIVSRTEALRARAVPIASRFRQKRKPGLIRSKLFDPEPVSATAFELYLRCPFKHYVRYVLRIEEEEDFDEGLTPLERGRIIHDILQAGFQEWDANENGPRGITHENYDEALSVFMKAALGRLPVENRHIELARLFGVPGVTGAIEWLLRLEMGRRPLHKRLLEYGFKNPYRFEKGPNGESPWWVQVKGRADRVDIDPDGHLHVFDYKSGKSPEPKLTIQVPLYALCLAQELSAQPVEAAYLSLRDMRLVPRQDYQAAADRLLEIYRDAREGRFPPRPHQIHLCNTCGYAGLCRKEIHETTPFTATAVEES